jgi:hypothetical protein
MIEIPTYVAITVVYWVVWIICCIQIEDPSSDVFWLFSIFWTTIGFIFWLAYTVYQLATHWNNIPQIIKFT